jgi:hypothetical protein
MTGDSTGKEPEEDLTSDDVASDDVASDDATDENIVLDSSDEGFADTIVEANVDALVAKMDATDAEEAAQKGAARKRLEELREQKSKDLDGTFDFDLDDDL